MRLFRKRIDWSDFILEILTIIIGITVAFSVENWNQEREERALELNWMKEISHDLSDTKERLNSLIEIDNNKLNGVHAFIRKIYESDSEYVHISSDHELNWTWLHPFKASSTSFEVIKSSGNTKVFQDQKMLLDLFRLYDNFDHAEMVVQYHLDEIGKWVDPILYKHFDMEKMLDATISFRVNRQEVSEIPMLRNQVFLFRYGIHEQIRMLKETSAKLDQVLRRVDKLITERSN